jgi:8-oxo-dGTP diphosphatase
MTTASPASTVGPLVAVYGFVGHEDRILLVRDLRAGTYQLPGGLVQPGESVEDALRRAMREQVGTDVARLDFCAAVEMRDHTDPNSPAVYELALLFDTTLGSPDQVSAASSERELRWVTDTDLDRIELHPTVIAERLRHGFLAAESPWWPTPS